MPLTPGFRLGPYEVVAPLGSGGMGEVYRARDTRLGREVAVKVLPVHLSEQPEIRARFEREAKTISSLNHPNICTLFDIGREGDTDFLVMELIEGETLADRVRRGPLPAPELLRLGTQVADALDRAHRAGVVHRDLKPANVMITKSGAKLMDFGLSRVTGLAGGSASSHSLVTLTQSPTMAQALTAEGTLLGTFQYMAPEQLEGKEADVRSDIWALGCVLYEMATGRRAFEGRSQASLIAAILEREPSPVGEPPSGASTAGASTAGAPPHGIERLIRNCLAKDPDERIQTAHDVKLQLQGIAELAGVSAVSIPAASAVALPQARARGGASARIPWAVAAGASLVAIASVAVLYPRTQVRPQVVRFRVDPVPGTIDTFWPRLSPDGKYLVMDTVDSASTARSYVRRMDQLEAHAIAGTEGLARSYWSPDSKEIAFIADGKLQRVAIGGGSPTLVCLSPGGSDLSWGSKGMILMDGRFTDSLRVVPAGGGELRPATRIAREKDEVGSAWPCFLPDGERFLFIGTRSDGNTGSIRLGKLGSLDSKLLGESDGRVEYAPGDWVLYVRGGALLAQKLDLAAGKLTGEPITITDGLRAGTSSGHFSVSRTGILAFAKLPEGSPAVIRTLDRAGNNASPVRLTGYVRSPRWSPDGRRMLYIRATPAGAVTGGGEVYVYDLERGTDTRLTFTGDLVNSAEWSPDGTRFACVARGPAGRLTVYLGSPDGSSPPDSIPTPTGKGAVLTQWSGALGKLVLWGNSGRSYTIGVATGDRAIQAIGDTAQAFVQAQVSPDGRWIAGASGSFPNAQVYVMSLTGPPGRWQVSTTSGIKPRWTKGGKEIVYETADGHLMAVDIDATKGFQVGTPHGLFDLALRAQFGANGTAWGVDGAGERFVQVYSNADRAPGTIEVVTDFRSLVTRR